MVKKLLKMILSMSLAISFSMTSFLAIDAAEAEQDTLSEELPIEIVLDKTNYTANDSIQIYAVVQNQSPTDLKGAELKLLFPNGYDLMNENCSLNVEDLGMGETLELNAEIKKHLQESDSVKESKPSEGSGPSEEESKSDDSAVDTGDHSTNFIPLFIVFVLVSVCSIVFLIYKGKRKNAMRCISLFLVGSLCFSSFAMISTNAESVVDDDNDAVWVVYSTSQSTTATVDGEKITVMAVFSFLALEEEQPDQEYSPMSCTGTLPANGTYGSVIVTSAKALADTISVTDVGMIIDQTGSFGVSLISVTKLDDNSLSVEFEGENCGMASNTILLELNGTCFADPSLKGIVAIPVEEPTPCFEIDDGSYVAENGLFNIPIDLGNIVLTDVNHTDNFTIDGEVNGITFDVVAIDGAKYDSKITLKIRANGGSSVEEQFDALDALLTENGICIADSSTSSTETLTVGKNIPAIQTLF